MKKVLASALLFALSSSFIIPEKKLTDNDCRLFRDSKFSFNCNNADCKTVTATADNITITGDAESMEFFQSEKGKELMDKATQHIFDEIMQGNMEASEGK